MTKPLTNSPLAMDVDTHNLSLDEVKAAHARIKDAIVRTPTLYSQTLSKITGAEIYLKFENLQFTAAYKERGALNFLLQMPEELRKEGVIAASAGNHSQGLSYHGTRLGVPVTIVMPTATPAVKIEHTKANGGMVILHGEKFDDAYEYARKLEKERSLTFVHPFDHPWIAAGQGTVALEMLEDQPGLDHFVIPIGGGGLFTGMGTAAKGINPDIKLTGVQAELYPSMYAHVQGEDLLSGGDTLAEGIAVKNPGKYTARHVAALTDDMLLIDEAILEKAVSLLLQVEKSVVEGAGAAGLAAVLANPDQFKGQKVGIVLCGGNIDTRLLANVLLRDLARSGRLARLRLSLRDQPGALFRVMRIFDEHKVNIIEIYHQRIFTKLPAKGLYTDIECEARDAEQIDALITSLRAAEYDVTQIQLS